LGSVLFLTVETSIPPLLHNMLCLLRALRLYRGRPTSGDISPSPTYLWDEVKCEKVKNAPGISPSSACSWDCSQTEVDGDSILPKGASSTPSLGDTENTEIDDHSIRSMTSYTPTPSLDDTDNTKVDDHSIRFPISYTPTPSLDDTENAEVDDRSIRSTTSYTPTRWQDSIEYVEVGGRGYYINRACMHQYTLPSDNREKDRQAAQFILWMKALRHQLILPPIHAPQYVLDVGTGSGTWAIELADQYLSARVIGVDAAPIQPKLIPKNCEFILDDAENSWLYKIPFDVIHLGHAQTWVRDWRSMAHQAFEALKPGGWIQLWFELPWEYTVSIPHHEVINRYERDLVDGANNMHISLPANGEFYKQLLLDTGFVGFREKKIYLDSSPMRALLQDEGLDSFGKGYICRGLGKDPMELEAQLAAVRNVLRDPTVEIRFPAIACSAQRPLGEGDLRK
jgi:SAM-dependent methyltransferase